MSSKNSACHNWTISCSKVCLPVHCCHCAIMIFRPFRLTESNTNAYFLNALETVPFVDMLFEVLATKAYRSNGSGASVSAPRSYGDSTSGTSADRTSHQRQEKHHRGDSDGSDDEDRSYKHARRDDTRDVSSSITSSSSNTNNINNNGRRREYSPSRPSDDNRSDSRRGGRSNDSNTSGQSDSDRRGDRSSQGGFSRQQGLTTAGFNNRNNTGNSNNSNAGMDRGQWNGSQQRNQFQDGGRGNFQDQQGNGSWRGGASNMRGGRGGMQGGQGFGQDRPKRQRCRDYDGMPSCFCCYTFSLMCYKHARSRKLTTLRWFLTQ